MDVKKWKRTVDGMERSYSILLAIASAPWTVLDSGVYPQVPCRHPAFSLNSSYLWSTSRLSAEGWPPLRACDSGVSACQQMPQAFPRSVSTSLQAGNRPLCTGGIVPVTTFAGAKRSSLNGLPCGQPPVAFACVPLVCTADVGAEIP